MTEVQPKIEGAPLIAPSTTDHPLYDSVVEACRTVFDPEIPVNIYDLGLVYTVAIDPENAVDIQMTLTAPGCPVAGEMPGWVADAVNGRFPGAAFAENPTIVHIRAPEGADMVSFVTAVESLPVNPDNPAQSQIFITTDPNGNASHPFKFGGNVNAFNAFRSAVSIWIQAEAP